jgi:hypothetical protein
VKQVDYKGLAILEFPDDWEDERITSYLTENEQQANAFVSEQLKQRAIQETDFQEQVEFEKGNQGFFETAGSRIGSAASGAAMGVAAVGKMGGRMAELAPPEPAANVAGGITRPMVTPELQARFDQTSADRAVETPQAKAARVEANPAVQWGRALMEDVEEAVPALPGDRNSFLSQVAQGVGTSVGGIAAGVVTGPAGALTAMWSAEADDAYESEMARQEKAGETPNPDKALLKAMGYGSIASAIEAGLGVGFLARRLQKAFGGSAKEAVQRGAAAGVLPRFVNGIAQATAAGYTEEASQRLAQDLIVQGSPNWQEINQEGLVGGFTQGLLDVPASAREAFRRRPTAAPLADTGAVLPSATDAVDRMDEIITPPAALTAEDIAALTPAAPAPAQEPTPAVPVMRPGEASANPIPEDPDALAEQIRLTADPASSKAATLITPGEEIPDDLPDGLMQVKTRHGWVIFNPEKIGPDEVAAAAAGDRFDGTILGMADDGTAPTEGTHVVTTSTPAAKNVVTEIVPDAATGVPDPAAAQVAAEAQAAAVPGGTTEVKPAIEVAKERLGEGFDSGTATTGDDAPTPARLMTPAEYASRILEAETAGGTLDTEVRDATTGKTTSGIALPGFGKDWTGGAVTSLRRSNATRAMWVQFNNAVSLNLPVNRKSADVLWGGPPPGWVPSTENGVEVYAPPSPISETPQPATPPQAPAGVVAPAPGGVVAPPVPTSYETPKPVLDSGPLNETVGTAQGAPGGQAQPGLRPAGVRGKRPKPRDDGGKPGAQPKGGDRSALQTKAPVTPVAPRPAPETTSTTPAPATPTTEPKAKLAKGDRVEWTEQGEKAPRTGTVLEVTAMGVSVDDEASGRKYLLASDRLRKPASPAPAPEPAPAIPAATALRKVEQKEGKPEASNEPKTSTPKALKVQREYLLKAVDEAITAAPESASTPEADADTKALADANEALREDFRKSTNQQERDAANAKHADALEPLFKKYGVEKTVEIEVGTPAKPKRKTDKLSTEARAKLLKDAIASSRWRGPAAIVFDVPGDGVFTIVNDKPTLRKFREVVQKKFPKGTGVAPTPSMGSVSAKETPKPAKPETFRDRLKLASPFVSEDETRAVITRVLHDGGILVATDGRAAVSIPAGSTTTAPKQYDPETGKQVTEEPNPPPVRTTHKDGRVTSVPGDKTLRDFPNYRQVVPTQNVWRAKVPIAPFLKMLNQAVQLWKGDEKKTGTGTVELYLDDEGNIGVKASNPDMADYNSGVTDSAVPIGAFNSKYLIAALELAARQGNSEVWISTSPDLLGPLGFMGDGFGLVLMPMRMSGEEAKPTKQKAAKESPALAKQWRKTWQLDSKPARAATTDQPVTGLSQEQAIAKVRMVLTEAGLDADVVFEPDWTVPTLSGGTRRVAGTAATGTSAMRLNAAVLAGKTKAQIRTIIRHELVHPHLATPWGVAQLAGWELSPAQTARLQEAGYLQEPGESDADYRIRLKDEFVAREAEAESSWWKRFVQRVKEILAKLGIRDLSNEEIARRILRNIGERQAEAVTETPAVERLATEEPPRGPGSEQRPGRAGPVGGGRPKATEPERTLPTDDRGVPIQPGDRRRASEAEFGSPQYVLQKERERTLAAERFIDESTSLKDALDRLNVVEDSALRAVIASEVAARAAEHIRLPGRPGVLDPIDASRLVERATREVQALKTDSAQGLQAQKQINRRLGPFRAVLSYLELIRSNQQRRLEKKFPKVVSDNIRSWLRVSARQAVEDVARAMKNPANVTTRKLREAARGAGIDWSSLFQSSWETQRQAQVGLYQALRQHPDLAKLTAEETRELTNLFIEAWAKEHNIIFQREFRSKVKTPDVADTDVEKLRKSLPRLIRYLNLGLLDDERFRNAIAPEYGIGAVDDATVIRLSVLAQEAQRTPEGVRQNKVYQRMVEELWSTGGINPYDLARDFWFANILSGLRTWIDVGVGSWLAGLTMVGRAAADSVVSGQPRLAARMIGEFVLSTGEAIANGVDIIRTGDVTRLPGAQAKLWDTLSGKGGHDSLEFAKASGTGWKRLIGQMAYVRRIMVALDYVGSMGTRDALMAWVALSRGDTESFAAASARYDRKARKDALAQAEAEMPGAKRVDQRARAREILEEGIDREVRDAATVLGQVAALNADPVGLGGIFYKLVAKVPWLLRAPMGLAFARAAINMAQNASDWMPVFGAVNFARSKASQTEWFQNLPKPLQAFGLDVPPERRRLILAAQIGGLALTAALAAFANDDDDEFEITGTWTGMPPSKRSQLMTEGERPLSIRVGGAWISYRNTPFAAAMAFVGNVRDKKRFDGKKWDDEEVANRMVSAWLMGALYIKDVSALSQFAQLIGASAYSTKDELKSGAKWMADTIGNFGAGFIPGVSMMREIDTMTDPGVYRPNAGMEYWLRNVPFARRTIGEGPAVNMLGDEISNPRTPWSRWLSLEPDDPVVTALSYQASQGVFLPVVSKTATIIGRDGERRQMNDEEFYAYQQAAGAAWREALQRDLRFIRTAKPEVAAGWMKKRVADIHSAARRRVRATE